MKALMGTLQGGTQSAEAEAPGAASAGQIPLLKTGGGFDVSEVKQYLHIIVKRIWLVTLCFVIAVAVALVYLLQKDPVFRSTAKIQISRSMQMPGSYDPEQQLMSSRDFDYLAVQQNIMQSRVVVSRAQERIGRPLSEIQENLKSLTANVNRKLAQLSVSVESLNPLLGSELANAVTEEFLEYKAEQRLDLSQSTVISLTQQANRIREELRKEEERLYAFEGENISFAVLDRSENAKKFLSSLTTREASIRMDRIMLEAQQPYIADASDDVILETLARPGGLQALSGGLSSPGLGGDTLSRGPQTLVDSGALPGKNWSKVKRERQQLLAELTEMRRKYKDAHPKIIETEQKLRVAEQELDLELKFALQEYYAKLDSMRIKEQAAQLAATQWEGEALRISRKYNDYALIKNDVNRLRTLYQTISTRLKEIDISVGFESENFSILQRAAPSKNPVSNKPVQNIFLAALIGMGIGIALVFALEYIDDSLRYPEEVRDALGLTFFGVIPAANWDPDDLNSHMLSNLDQKSGLSEAYRNVRSALIFSGNTKQGTSIAFTSAVPREGKTTTTLNMSVSLSQAGSRVLLVDADLRRGELHKFFGLEGGKGFADVLAGRAKPDSLIQRTGIPNLDLIATGPFPPNPAELLFGDEFKSFLEYTRRTYDITLFDCPPVMAVSEASIMASLADSSVFVVWAGQTSRKLSQMSVNILRERGANIVGAVLNNLEFGRVGYYYYSTYYGYYDYDYRYESTPS